MVKPLATRAPRQFSGGSTGWENWVSTCKIIKLNSHLTTYAKINSKGISDLNIRIKTIKLLGENRRKLS